MHEAQKARRIRKQNLQNMLFESEPLGSLGGVHCGQWKLRGGAMLWGRRRGTKADENFIAERVEVQD